MSMPIRKRAPYKNLSPRALTALVSASLWFFASCATATSSERPPTENHPALSRVSQPKQTKDTVVALGLDGRQLLRAQVDAESGTRQAWLLAELQAAVAGYKHDPSELQAIWVGRRLAYLGRLREAISWYEESLLNWPESFRLRRHLGHRLLSVRDYSGAIQVLEEARALASAHPNRTEPDGMPGPAGTPRSTTHGNIDYHLALAHYLSDDFERAAQLWRAYLALVTNDDSRVAGTHWLYTSLMRAGRSGEARSLVERIPAELDVIENFAYFDLVQLYAGRQAGQDLEAKLNGDPAQNAALSYGLARWYITQGEPARGLTMLNQLISSNQWPNWAAFGAMAAEADLNNLPSGIAK